MVAQLCAVGKGSGWCVCVRHADCESRGTERVRGVAGGRGSWTLKDGLAKRVTNPHDRIRAPNDLHVNRLHPAVPTGEFWSRLGEP